MRARRLRLRALGLALGAALGVGFAMGRPAVAEERVPRILPSELPAAGTVAPLSEGNLTHVLVGRADELGWYRVAGERGTLDDKQLLRTLEKRAGVVPAGSVSGHAVWITASAEHRWVHVLKVALACQRAGIYRIGVRVRSDSAPGVFGFPLFLPPARDPATPKQGRATELAVRVQSIPKEGAPPPRGPDGRPLRTWKPPVGPDGRPLSASNPQLTYLAAKRMVQKYGRVVAVARLATNGRLQDAITVIDMLYRAGCTAVRLPMRMLTASPKVEVDSLVWIGKTPLAGREAPQRAPDVAPRAVPWGLHGANDPVWIDLDVQPPEEGPVADPAAQGDVVPSHVAKGGVPAFTREQANADLGNWARDLGASIEGAITGGPQLMHLLVEAQRQPAPAARLLEDLRSKARGVDAVSASSLQVVVGLEQQGRVVGEVELLLSVAGSQVGIVNATWVGAPRGGTWIDAERGEPASLRVYLEAQLLAARAGGAHTMRWAGLDEVLREFPAVAHAGIRRQFAARDRAGVVLAQALQTTRFDRIRVRPGQVAAALRQRGAVVGVLYAGIASEAAKLRVRSVRVRRAP